LTENKNISTKWLIADDSIIEQLKKQMQFVDRDNANWTETYLDNNTGVKWLYYRVNTELQGGGYPILGRLPLPDKVQLIELALFSESEDEVFAACRTLTDNEEILKIDFREDLINRLENINDNQRQNRVIKLTGLDSGMNRREILGKRLDQVNSDSSYFKNIADRAEKLKRR